MILEKEKTDKQHRKVDFCDKTLWGKYLQILGIVSSIVTLISFFVTAEDIGVNRWILAGSFVAAAIIFFYHVDLC